MCYIKAIQSRTWRLHLQQFFKDLDSEKPRICVVSHFRNLENTQKKIVTHRLHHEEMRIFKVRKRSEKSRRYVITRIYGFFVFSEICTFVQCGVRRNNIRRIFCRCVLKFTCEKIVRQCDRKTLLYYGFPVDSCYFGKFLLFPVLFWLCPKLEILSFPKKLCDNATAVLPCKIF